MLTWRPRACCVCLVLSLLAGGCRRPPAAEAPADSGVVVSVQAARLEPLLQDIAAAPGIVVPAPGAEQTVFAPEAAEVAELARSEGDTVRPGDLLVRFEIPSIAQAMATLQLDVAQASARVAHARTESARQSTLFDRGLISRNAFDASRLDQANAESAQREAQTRLETAEAAQDVAAVRARFAGTVVQVWHAAGDQVRAGTDDPVLRVIDPSRVQVAVQLPISQLARVVPGQTASVTPIAGTSAMTATVVRRADSAGAGAPTGEVRLALAAQTVLPLDTPTSVQIVLDRRTNALVVPSAAVARDELGPFVMTAGDDGRAHHRDVRLGLATRDLTQVAEGLSAGERVIVDGRQDVTEGTPIRPAR